jgi:hypothetical protein
MQFAVHKVLNPFKINPLTSKLSLHRKHPIVLWIAGIKPKRKRSSRKTGADCGSPIEEPRLSHPPPRESPAEIEAPKTAVRKNLPFPT